MFHLRDYANLIEILRERTDQQGAQTLYTFLPDGESEAGSLTYAELDRQARAIAVLLQNSLAQPGERVLLLYPPGLEYISAFWGCLYAGMVAVPSYPPRLNRPDPRLQTIAQDARARVALTTPEIVASIQQRLANTPDLASIDWLTTQALDISLADQWKEPQVTGDTLAFLQYTSGSTAQPKGVMVSHGNLIHNLKQIRGFFGVTPHSRGVFWLPPYHDMGLIGGILEPLYGGAATQLMPPTAFLQKPARWLQAMSRSRATMSGAPNFAYEFCSQKITEEQKRGLDLSHWELAFCGAEPIRRETLERFVAAFGPYGFRREALYTCYGLAEATLIASGSVKGQWPAIRTFSGDALAQSRVALAAPDDKNPRELVSCGASLSDQQLIIVDPQTLQRCPAAQVGEIWLAGPSIAQGYWNLPAETVESFQARLADGGGPFMRSGDLGFLHEGELYIAGRAKDLIIIRGRNHYPQDIELTVETSHPALPASSAAAFSVDVAGEERLVVVQELDRHTKQDEAPGIIAAIRQAVVEQHELQVYAVVLIRVGSIPRTSSFKIQRRACKAQYLDGSLTVIASDTLEAQAAPEEPQERPAAFIRKALAAVSDPAARQTLLTIYLQEQAARLLRIPAGQVDAQRPLNSLGLDSMTAIELKFAIETDLQISLPMEEFLQGGSAAELAASLLERQAQAPAAAAQAAPETLPSETPLSHGQQALWFLHQLAPESAAYNVPSVVRIRSALDNAALRRAFEKLMARHPSLRATFVASPVSGNPIQVVQAQMALDFQEVDASALDDAALKQRLDGEANGSFDLARGPLLRVRVFKQAGRDYILLVVMHHIITDFWSLALMVEELSRLYPAECAGQALTLPPSQIQYADYVHQEAAMLAGPKGGELWAYWQEQLSGELPVLNLPGDRPRPPVQTYNGSLHTFHLNAGLTGRIKALSQAQGTTLNMLLLAAFDALLYRYTGQPDFLIGSLATGRNRADQAGIVGYFVNPIVLRARPASRQTFVEFLAQTRQTVLGAFDHQEYPFDLLVNRLQPARDYSRSPLFQVMFVFQRAYKFNEQGLTPFSLDISGEQMELAGLRLESMALERRAAQFDLTLTMGEAGDELIASFEYNTDLYEAAAIARMAVHLETLLEGIVADPQRRLGELPLLSGDEKRRFLVEWNGEQSDLLPELTTRALFEAQAARTPDAPAVIFDEKSLTYRQLDQKASRLAGYLKTLGVCPESFVSICMDRSLELMVAILGVLKAGGAYAPLDPAYPRERLAFILAETNSSVLLTQTDLLEGLPQSAAQVICLDGDWESAAADGWDGAGNPVSDDGHSAVCVIYTSGSTGKPKGVVLENRGIVNLIDSFTRSYLPTSDDRILPLTSVGSASFVGEIFPLLCVGGTLVLARVEEFLDLERLFALIARQRVSIISAVPTVIAGLNQKKGNLTSLRWLLSGGEALDIEDIDELLKSVSIVNSYGLTETSVCSMFYKVSSGPSGARSGVPIGTPIINTEVYVLDADLNCLPIGCAGELYISGAGLARGYLANPALTAALFLPNPFKQGERMYRTGDLARWLPDGVLEYLQRADDQVKIRGFRIELGEIEAALKQQAGVRDALVLVREETAGGGAGPLTGAGKRLVAYVLADGQTPLTHESLHSALVERLPAYMIPAVFEMLDAWPLTPNGKVDVKALPLPTSMRPSLGTDYVAPQSDLERKLALIWQEVLKVEKVGTQDNFFDLGGNSLLIAQAHQRLQTELGIQLSLVDLFRYPSIGLLAQWLSRKDNQGLEMQQQVDEEAQKRRGALNRRRQLAQENPGETKDVD